MVVLRLCGSSQRGAQLSTDLNKTPTRKGGVMCKALACSGRVTGQAFCRLRLALQHRRSIWRGSLALHIALRWVTRAFRRRRDSHVDVVRLRGRRSGARVSGRLLHAKPKIGCAAIERMMCSIYDFAAFSRNVFSSAKRSQSLVPERGQAQAGREKEKEKIPYGPRDRWTDSGTPRRRAGRIYTK